MLSTVAESSAFSCWTKSRTSRGSADGGAAEEGGRQEDGEHTLEEDRKPSTEGSTAAEDATMDSEEEEGRREDRELIREEDPKPSAEGSTAVDGEEEPRVSPSDDDDPQTSWGGRQASATS